VVLVSGISYGLWIWRWVRPHLEPRVRAVTFDNRGVDGTDKPAGPYTTAMMAEDVLGLMDALGLPAATLVGHSLGGMVAQEVALARPDRVTGLALVGTSFGGPQCEPPTPAALKVLMDRTGDPRAVAERALGVNSAPGFAERCPEIVAEYFRYRERLGMTPESYQGQLQAGLRHDSQARLGALKMPVLILHGELDQVMPFRNAELLAARIPHARVERFAGAGHMLPLERPPELAEQIASFARA
jgi:pimeloyl-ACP methyl ester carboxylesterase